MAHTKTKTPMEGFSEMKLLNTSRLRCLLAVLFAVWILTHILIRSVYSRLFQTEVRLPPLTVIALGCDQANGLVRTLNSVRAANAPEGTKLHICVDGCGDQKVEDVARQFQWGFGEKKITLREESIGPARHTASCWEHPSAGEWALFLQDDVIVSPLAFSAFADAWRIRSAHNYKASIVSIALHDTRVNEYCWKSHIHTKPCPELQKKCQLESSTWVDGALLCMKNQSRGSWMLSQLPSSSGAFYEGKAWSTFQNYYDARVQLSVGESLVLEVPHSFSNEWKSSWKRFMLELMFRAGWTSMYRIHEEHHGFSTTTRNNGVDTERSPLIDGLQGRKRCLQSAPLDSSSSLRVDRELLRNPMLMNSLDYCTGAVSIKTLVMQGTASVSYISKHLDGSRPALSRSLSLLREANEEMQAWLGVSSKSTTLSSGYDLQWRDKAEIIVVTSFASTDKDFAVTAENFKLFEGRVHYIVAAPERVCRELMRGNIHATCLDEELVSVDGIKLPVISNMLGAAVDFAGPKVKWIGVMNGDVSFDYKSLVPTLNRVSSSDICSSTPCAVTGQRYDIDWKTKEERLHSEFGMDYFIFNRGGVEFVLQEGVLPPFCVGLVRWDSWLMGFLASNQAIHTIDASPVLKVSHYMDFRETFKSKTNTNLWNLRHADEMYRLGRTDNANFRINATSLDPLKSASVLQETMQRNKFRYQFDGWIERSTGFTYTTGGMPFPAFACLCDLLLSLVGDVDVLGSKYCEMDSEYVVTSRVEGAKLKAPFFFQKEFFETVNGQIIESNNISGLGGNGTNCCVFLDKSDPPTRIPDIFWTSESNNMDFKCI